jgi:DeoR/GlpR family transcriptional regulator of sugar metabolism
MGAGTEHDEAPPIGGLPSEESHSGRRHGLRQTERLDAITELVLGAGSMRIDELTQIFGVSTMTIHRDLDTLDAQGILRKSRGVVTAVATSLFEASTEYRARQARAEKEAVSRAAFSLVEPGQAVTLDDSTTGLLLAELLLQRQPLTVITNFQRVINILIGHPGIALISTGGQYYQWCEAFMGTVATTGLSTLRADIAFISSPAVTDGICFHQHHDAVLIKRAMFDAARKRVLYLDHTKFEKRALHAHHKVSDFDVVIVDSNISPDDLTQLQDTGVEIMLAPVTATRRDR